MTISPRRCHGFRIWVLRLSFSFIVTSSIRGIFDQSDLSGWAPREVRFSFSSGPLNIDYVITLKVVYQPAECLAE